MRRALAAACLAIPLLLAGPAPASEPAAAQDNAALVRAAFQAWHDGDGSVFDLLHDDVAWTVAGTSPVSGTYVTRQDFMKLAVLPINARLATPITPVVQHVLAQDDAVLVVWQGHATTTRGGQYSNHYAWLMHLDAGKVMEVTAFLDTWALQQLMHGADDSP